MTRLAALILLASVSGCALFRGGTAPAPFLTQANQALYRLDSWRMEGRIGVQTAGDAWQANLFWDHDTAQDRLRLSGPLSQGMVSIVVQKDLIYINEGKGRTELSRRPDALLRDRLGFSVPLSSLRYWILGLPDPQLGYTPLLGDGGSPAGFLQSGWTIRLDRFTTAGTRVVPQKMSVQGSGVKLKILADTWEIKG